MNKNSKILRELAEKLAMNSVNVSLWDIIKAEKDVYQRVFKSSTLSRKIIDCPERFIIVVGAGASHNAFNELQLGSIAAENLKKHFQGMLGEKSKLIDEELKRLERVFRLNKKDFETILLAISKFFPVELKQEISERYKHKYYPSLTYEIIAHLIKHRFVDAVINFNFDELLDQAIEDELGYEEYKKVIVEGDYDLSSIMDETGLKYPIYLKPHGTSSNPSSLRFTREDYFTIPPGIATLIENLLRGTNVSIDSTNEITPVNLIVIGFDMQSFEFNMLFEDCFPPNSKIYFINLNLPTKPVLPIEELEEKKDKREEFLKMFEEDNLIKIHKDNVNNDDKNEKYTLDEVMEELWKNIENCFQDNYKPRSIARHKLISSLFKQHKLIPDKRKSIEYLKDRTWLELVLSIAKYKGFVCLDQLKEDRFGKYFTLYLQECKKFPCETNNYPQTIWQFCDEIGLSRWGYSGKAFRLDEINNVKVDNLDISILTIDESSFERQLPIIFNKLLEKVHDYTKTNLLSCKNIFESSIKDLFKKEDSEVSTKHDSDYNSIFKKYKLIKSSLALDYYTRSYFRKDDWTTIFIVAETGEWLLEKAEDFVTKNVKMIIADNGKMKDIEKKFPKGRILGIHQLNWWLHNQHMTIFLKGKRPNFEPLRAIYFVRRYRSTHIHPIILESNECKILLDTFGAYCQKSENIKLSKKKNVPSEVNKKNIEKFYIDFFNDWIANEIK